MRSKKFSKGLVLLFSIALIASACSIANADSNGSHGNAAEGSNPSGSNTGSSPAGIHFKIDGKQYDISIVRGIYEKKGAIFSLYNAGLPGFPVQFGQYEKYDRLYWRKR
jgi:hypothetical protein